MVLTMTVPLVSVLLLVCLTIGYTTGASYSPANGFFVCPEAGMACMVAGCESGGCSITHNGFEKGNSANGRTVYTATIANSNLSILGADSTTEIACEASCECQLIKESIGCVIANQVVSVSEGVVNSQGGDSSLGSDSSNGLLIALAASLLVFLAFLLLGLVWYRNRKKVQLANKESSEDTDGFDDEGNIDEDGNF